ncbi:hypothetical protein [Moorena sp. SIO4A5]|uniref:hypothetical protein n=1 Tax=unclassified Moorena TaxID=2683338 RepID=UPI0034124CA9
MSKTMTSAVVPNTPVPPTQYELPCDDGIPMETERHKLQMELLIDPLYPWLAQWEDGYVGGNMFLHFSAAQIRNQDFRVLMQSLMGETPCSLAASLREAWPTALVRMYL